MFSKLSVFRSLAILLVPGMLALPACGDPTGSGDHASVIVFLQGDAEVARYVYPGQITGAGLSVGPGATATYRMRVLTTDGRQLGLDGQEFSIQGVVVGNQAIASAGLATADQVLITGILPGTTSLEFSLWHVGHEEFRVVGVPITVRAP